MQGDRERLNKAARWKLTSSCFSPPTCSQTIAISTPLCSGLSSVSQWEVWSERGGNCSEFGGNWKHLYPPCVSIFICFINLHTPSFSVAPTFYTNTVLMAPHTQPALHLLLDWIDANDCVSICRLKERLPTCVLCPLFSALLSPIAGIDALLLFPPAQGVEWFVGKLGDPSGVWWLLLIHTRLSISYLPNSMLCKLYR